MGYGCILVVNGEVFNWVFNYFVNYWDVVSVMVNYLLDENGGSFEGKEIVLFYYNFVYGKELICILEVLFEELGFDLIQIVVDYFGQEQKLQWFQICCECFDYVLMWGWGVMNQVVV